MCTAISGFCFLAHCGCWHLNKSLAWHDKTHDFGVVFIEKYITSTFENGLHVLHSRHTYHISRLAGHIENVTHLPECSLSVCGTVKGTMMISSLLT